MGSKDQVEYEYIKNEQEFNHWLTELEHTDEPISIDFETTDLRPRVAELVGIATATGPEYGSYISFGTDNQARKRNRVALDELLQVVGERRLIAHNANYELSIITNLTPTIRSLNFEDTLIMAKLAGREWVGLKRLVKEELGFEMEEFNSMLTRSGVKNIKQANPADVAPYAAADAVYTYKLWEHFNNLLDVDSRKVYEEIELPLLPVVVAMQLEGFHLDERAIIKAESTVVARQEKLYEDIRDRYRRDVTSGKVRLEIEATPTKRDPGRSRIVHFGPMGKRIGPPMSLSYPKSKTWEYNPASSNQASAYLGLPNARAETYEENGEELALLHRDYDHLSKLISSYINPVRRMYDDLQRAYFSFNQSGTDTGRFSASGWKIDGVPWGVNAQTAPKPKGNEDSNDPNSESKLVRRQFTADPSNTDCCGIHESHDHSIIELDYSQIELRVLAHWSRDNNMLEAYQMGRDLHDEMMRNSGLTDRRIAKILNFGCAYESNDYSAAGVVKRAAVKNNIRLTDEEAQNSVSMYRKAWPQIPSYYAFIEDFSHNEGYAQTLDGRRTPARYVDNPIKFKPKYNSDHWEVWVLFDKKNKAELRRLINMPIQGTAADILKKAMVAMFPTTPDYVKWKGTVHDSLIFQTPVGKEEECLQWAKPFMEETTKLLVPILIEGTYGPNWADQKEMNYAV